MDLATIGIWLALILIAIGVLAIVLFGVKSIAAGKFRLMSMAAMAIPVVVFGIALAISSGAEQPIVSAAVLTGIILLIGATLAVLVTGLRSVVGI